MLEGVFLKISNIEWIEKLTRKEVICTSLADPFCIGEMIECGSTDKKTDDIEWNHFSYLNFSTKKKDNNIDRRKICQISIEWYILNPYIILTNNKWSYIRSDHTQHKYNLRFACWCKVGNSNSKDKCGDERSYLWNSCCCSTSRSWAVYQSSIEQKNTSSDTNVSKITKLLREWIWSSDDCETQEESKSKSCRRREINPDAGIEEITKTDRHKEGSKYWDEFLDNFIKSKTSRWLWRGIAFHSGKVRI